MPETQAEIVAKRYADMLARAGWTVSPITPVADEGQKSRSRWVVPATVSCWVRAVKDPGSRLIMFGWETVTAGAPGTTRYLGGYLNQPLHARPVERRLNLRTLRVLNEIIKELTR